MGDGGRAVLDRLAGTLGTARHDIARRTRTGWTSGSRCRSWNAPRTSRA
jgi:hypothetical protein